jgi:hypothetical protein
MPNPNFAKAIGIAGLTCSVMDISAALIVPFSLKAMLIGVVIHIFCVGMPISLNIRKYAR